MKYAHLADLHIGSWRDQKMCDLSLNAFAQAIDNCLEKKVDFILFSGDLFNTSLPAIESLKSVTSKLKQLQEENIPVYVVPGSHDFSPSGKTMIDVLEKAGLLINVCKGSIEDGTLTLHFTIDKKTGTKITGMLGKKGMLDKTYYQNLNLTNLENETGYKIFLFHTTLSELKPKHLEMMDSQPLSFLPKNFNYYAGGHVHHPTELEQPGYGTLTYPGALFPNNFTELETYHHGGYYLIETNENQQTLTWTPIKIIDHLPLSIDCNNKSPEVVLFDLLDSLREKDLQNTLLTIRLFGTISSGKTSDINFKKIFQQIYEQGAYFVMKNTSKLQSPGFEEIKIDTSAPEQIEEEIIKEHLQQIKLFDPETELNLAKNLLHNLNTEKQEGETIKDFQDRVKQELNNLLNLKEEMK
ncbi:exonuclease SbcCD subunit D [Candidatus Woesearchaeota archaeon]|jgi:DNA repair protein SbcD/Mre11|nr:exonuclease SbcCD subunit D [Candidatus Woesearchaeota archaeon]